MSPILRQARFTFRVVEVFLARHRKIVMLGGLVGIILALGLTLVLPHVPLPKAPERIGMVGSYTAQTLPEFIQNQITSGLTQIDENQEVRPGMAASWEAKDEGQTWVFNLTEGMVWQDGTPVKAKDVSYGFNDVEIKPLSDNQVSFHLKDPFAPLPAVVSRPVFKRGLLGTGPYKVKQLRQARGNIELLYLVTENKQTPDIIYRFYATEMMAKTAFKLGEVDRLIEVSDPGEFTAWKGVKIESQTYLERYVAIFFNTQDATLANKSVRQALAYGLKKGVVGQVRATSPIHPNSWAYNSQVKNYEYNVEKAKKLLADNLPEGGREISLVALPSLLSEAERVKADWEVLGIKVHILVINVPPDNYQAILVTQLVGPDPDQYSLWHSTQKGSNLSHYFNPRIDKLLEDGRKTLDQEKRREIYFDFQRFLVEDCPAVFLYHPVTYTVSRR